MEELIKIRDVSKIYKGDGIETVALDKISLDIYKGSFTMILGPSGAGKTTLLNLLGGMDSVTSGSLVVGNKELFGMNEEKLGLYRRDDVGFVFQFYNLMPNLTALENVELAVEVCKNAFSPKTILEKVGLSDKMGNFPAQLSGGQQQRVSIARAVAKNPLILLCDEPTGALDYNTGKQILRLLYDLCKKSGITVIIVTHNSAIKDMADTVIDIKNGKIEEIIKNTNPTPIEEIEW